MSLASGLSKVGTKAASALSSFTKTKSAKYIATGAGLGGGAYLTATGVSRGIDEVNEASGIGALISTATGTKDKEASKGFGTIGTLVLVLGVVALVLFVFMPKHNKNKASRS